MEQDIVYTQWNWVRECHALNVAFSGNKEETKEETAIQKRGVIRARSALLVILVSFLLDVIGILKE